MLKTQTSVMIAGAVAIILDIILFKAVLGLPYLRLTFLGAAVVLYLGFLLYTGDYYSESEATRLDKRSPGTRRRYKSDKAYTLESFAAVLILLVPVTALLVSMLLNQQEIYHIPFLLQTGIAVAGWVFLHLIAWVFEIGDTHSIGYSESERRVNHVNRMREEQRQRREERIRDEAAFVVKQAILGVLGVPEAELTPNALMANDLGCDPTDAHDILSFYNNYLRNTYHNEQGIEPAYGMVKGERMRRFETIRMRFYTSQNKGITADQCREEFFEQFLQIYPTVADQCEFMEGFIDYYRRN